MSVLLLRGGTTNADKILKAIEIGNDIDLDEDVLIEGNLDLSLLNLPKMRVNRTHNEKILGLTEETKLVTSSISIKRSRIKGTVDFSNSRFLKAVNFGATHFEKSVDFRGSKFRGCAIFASCVIEEDTIFLQTEFNESLIFDGASIKNVNFNNSHFFKTTSFWHSKFNIANFINCNFNGEVRFIEASFEEHTFFSDTVFKNSVDFANATFVKGVHFDNSEFRKGATFTWAKFISKSQFLEAAYFVRASFGNIATFWDTLFDGIAHFYGVNFYNDADFKNTKFNDDADFGGATFYGNAKFNHVNFERSAYFKDSLFLKNLVLVRALIQEIRLRDVRFFGESCTSLDYTQISDAEYGLKMRSWDKSCIVLWDSDITQLFVDWDNIKNHIAYDPASYLMLAKNLRDSGKFGEADDCYYQYRDLNLKLRIKSLLGAFREKKQEKWKQYQHKQQVRFVDRKKSRFLPLICLKNFYCIFIDCLEYLFYGYGVRPFRAIPFSFCVILIFSLIFLRINGAYDTQSITNAINNSTIAFISNSRSIKWDSMHILALIEGLIGWLLMALFLVTLGRNRPR